MPCRREWHPFKMVLSSPMCNEMDLDAPVPPHTGWSGLSYPPYGVPDQSNHIKKKDGCSYQTIVPRNDTIPECVFCEICFERFNESLDKAPKMLTCHTVCAYCLKRVVNNRTILIPPNAEFRGNDIYQALLNKREFVHWIKNSLLLVILIGFDWRFQWSFVFSGSLSVFGGNGICQIRNGHLNGGGIIRGASCDRGVN